MPLGNFSNMMQQLQQNKQSADRLDLFNEQSLTSFNHKIHKGVKLVSDQVGSLKAPFSGISPAQLSEKFHTVDLEQPLDSLDHALAELKSLYLEDAVYFHHPKYLAHLNTPITNVSILAELVQAAINTSVDTWDQSAGGTLIEQKLIDWTLARIGYKPNMGDGIFTSGGTQSNLMALLLARDNYCLEKMPGYSVQESGLPEQASRMRIFTSELSHFSIQKSAALLGLGFNSVIPIPSDKKFRMDIKALEKAVADSKARGEIPLAIVATMGTTDFGSIDPIVEISSICQQNDIWLHGDAAYGCGLLVSEKYSAALENIVLADSITIDYHKSFFQPVACGAFLAKDKRHLSCLSYHADYLNPLSDKNDGIPNLVSKSLQTTRRFDALKLWLTLRTLGSKTLGEAFDRVMDLAAETYSNHADDRDLEFLHVPEISTLVFRFNPLGYLVSSERQLELLDHINTAIRKKLARNADAMIAATKVEGRVYLKFTLLNPHTESHHIDEVLLLITQYGYQLLDEVKHHFEVQVCNKNLYSTEESA